MAAPPPSEVDVLIVGAGPAGLMLALWLSRLGVKTRIVDKRTDKVFSGQADGFQVRTLEILDSFGLGERVWKEANHLLEVSFWNPDETGRIRRSTRAPDNIGGLSRFTEAVLHQGRMETFFLDAIAASHPHPALPADQPRLAVERMVIPTALAVDEALADSDDSDDADAHPVTVTLRHLTEAEATPTQRLSNLADGLFRSNLAGDDVASMLAESGGRADAREETVRAKYVVGCDGAHSWTRRALGPEFEMKGEMTDFIWGVLDIVPITDFPDIRNRCMIHSASSGSLMIIPRENKLVRLYIQLTEVSAGGGRVDRSQITPEMIFKAAQKTISPYKLDYHYCDWWTAYQIGQRVGDKFSKLDRVFLAGDAVHTHSPKAGQGMNVSMQDAYNLGWKIGLACKGVVRREILSTYELERKQIARQLIEFDHRFSRLFSGRPAKDIMDETGVSMDEFSKAFNQSHMFTSGIGVDYSRSVLVAKSAEQDAAAAAATDLVAGDPAASASTAPPAVLSTPELATNCRPGTRFPSHQVLAQADGRPWELHHKMPSDGRFRLVVFPGRIATGAAAADDGEADAKTEAAQRRRRRRLQLVNDFGEHLTSRLLPKYPRLALSPGADPHGSGSKFRTETPPSILHVLLVHAGPRAGLEPLRDLHAAYHAFDPRLGWDYDAVFADGESLHAGHGRAYAGYGVDPDPDSGHQGQGQGLGGAIVAVRPDGYVGLVVGLEPEGWEQLERYLDGVLRTTGA
ncbi:FAD binding domain-containing protein [Xylariaceae sp. FL0804]|nr:FAD binding domain-containing protein [Xylariaceae sp. FL0804]